MQGKFNLPLLVVLFVTSQVKAQDPRVHITQTDPATAPGSDHILAQQDRDITLDCYVENLLDNALVRWQRQNTGIDGNTVTKPISQDMAMEDNIHYSMEKPTQFTWRLRIRSIQISDEGTYTCFVQVTLNSKASASKVISVVYLPVFDTARISGHTVVKYLEDVSLVCNASARPNPIIEWSRLGGSLLPIGQEKFRGSVLKLTKVQPDDRGIYRCTATNKVGSVIHDVNLEVAFSPVIAVTRTTVLQAQGYRAELQCLIEANPFPDPDTQVAWIKGSATYSISTKSYEVRLIQGAFNHLLYELIIYSVKRDDYGTYSCRVSNIYGTTSGQILLQETQEPQPSIKLGRVVAGNERLDSSAAMMKPVLVKLLYITFLALFLAFDFLP